MPLSAAAISSRALSYCCNTTQNPAQLEQQYTPSITETHKLRILTASICCPSATLNSNCTFYYDTKNASKRKKNREKKNKKQMENNEYRTNVIT